MEEAFPSVGEKEDPDRFWIVAFGLLRASISSFFFLPTRMQGVLWGGFACLFLNRFAAAYCFFLDSLDYAFAASFFLRTALV